MSQVVKCVGEKLHDRRLCESAEQFKQVLCGPERFTVRSKVSSV